MLLIFSFTLIIGWIVRHNEEKAFDRKFDQIQKSYLDVIQTALWVDDQETLKIILMGICRLPGIEYAHIHTKDNEVCEAGRKGSAENLNRLFPIIHTYNGHKYTLGQLHVAGSLDYVHQKIIRTVIPIALSQALIILFISLLVLFLVYRIVIGRLLKITGYTSSLSLNSLDTPLEMDQGNGYPDELNDLANAVNDMRGNLHQAFTRQRGLEDELREQHKNLEKLVAQKTSSLIAANRELQMEISERKKIETEREKLISDLKGALHEVKKLSGMLPICANCKKIRDDRGYWNQIEAYISTHSEAEFSHGICPECAKKLYPDLDLYPK